MKKKTTVSMRFSEDKFIDGEIAYNKGEVYEINACSVDRWLKRGGEIVDGSNLEEIDSEVGPVSPEDSDELLQAESERQLAEQLEKQNKVDHAEVEQALEKEEALKEEIAKEEVPAKSGKQRRNK